MEKPSGPVTVPTHRLQDRRKHSFASYSSLDAALAAGTRTCLKCKRTKIECSGGAACQNDIDHVDDCRDNLPHKPAKRDSESPVARSESADQKVKYKQYAKHLARQSQEAQSAQYDSRDTSSAALNRGGKHRSTALDSVVSQTAYFHSGSGQRSLPAIDPLLLRESSNSYAAPRQSQALTNYREQSKPPQDTELRQQYLTAILHLCRRDQGIGYRLPDYLLDRNPDTGQVEISGWIASGHAWPEPLGYSTNRAAQPLCWHSYKAPKIADISRFGLDDHLLMPTVEAYAQSLSDFMSDGQHQVLLLLERYGDRARDTTPTIGSRSHGRVASRKTRKIP